MEPIRNTFQARRLPAGAVGTTGVRARTVAMGKRHHTLGAESDAARLDKEFMVGARAGGASPPGGGAAADPEGPLYEIAPVLGVPLRFREDHL